MMIALNRFRPLIELVSFPKSRLQDLFNVPNTIYPVRHITLSSKCLVKSIVEKQDGKTLVVEGVISPSPRKDNLIKADEEHKACPLCRLNLDVKHTDVLILSQFVRQDGSMMPKRITGLCTLQQKRVSFMVTMAHKAGLMGKFKPPSCSLDPTRRPKWKKFNTYFDETTIKPTKWFVALKYQQHIDEFKKALQEKGST